MANVNKSPALDRTFFSNMYLFCIWCSGQVPTLFFALQHPNTSVNWGYHAEKSKYASKSLKRGSYWPRGKMLGGSHALNAMVHVRGSDRDFNDWEKFGNPGWGWDSALHYFKKSEGLKVKEVAEADGGKFHNTEGPLKIDSYHNKEPVRSVVLDGAAELGYKTLPDINAEEYIGMTVIPGTLDGNRRCTSAKAFLVPAKDRPNFHVVKNAHVTKVLINDKKEATGVEFILNHRKFTVKAKKETVLSAGAINTPQILMLSGIGPEKHLKKHQIKTIANLPVGKHLEDHTVVIYPVTYNKVIDITHLNASPRLIQIENLINPTGQFHGSISSRLLGHLVQIHHQPVQHRRKRSV